MINGMFNNSSIPYLEEMVHFSQQRQHVLAGNVANLGVPGYRTRDLSVETFQETLAEAIQARQDRDKSLTSPQSETEPSDPMGKVRVSMDSLLRHDDKNVGIEQQVREMSKNQYMHTLAVTIMTNQFHLLQTMISERV